MTRPLPFSQLNPLKEAIPISQIKYFTASQFEGIKSVVPVSVHGETRAYLIPMDLINHPWGTKRVAIARIRNNMLAQIKAAPFIMITSYGNGIAYLIEANAFRRKQITQ